VNYCAHYVDLGKGVLPGRASDRALGEKLGYAQSTIAEAKAGRMSDGIALALGELLVKHGLIAHAGEVMLAAHAERKTGRARATLLDYAKNVVALVPSKAVSALCAFAVALGMFLPSHDALAYGGEGQLR
jgi:hypothetical protein